VVADSDADVAKIIDAHPEADYYLPSRFQVTLAGVTAATHELLVVSDDRFFLLSRRSVAPASARRFRLPGNW
jgi:hypothetical protein